MSKKKMPWESEPTVWDRFCFERNLNPEKEKEKNKTDYLEQQKNRERYRWFSAGFYYGGQS